MLEENLLALFFMEINIFIFRSNIETIHTLNNVLYHFIFSIFYTFFL